MISAIVTTHNSARHLVRCLAPLVAGVADGLVKEAIVADAGSSDDSVAMAEEAGCRVVSGDVRDGANAARGDWLLVLPACAMLEAGWIEDVRRFVQRAPNGAACFRYAREDGGALAGMLANAAAAWFNAPRAEQGLLLPRARFGARPRLEVLRTRVIVRG